MQGIAEFAAFCHDEFWDCRQTLFGRALFLEIDPFDPRRDKIREFLEEIRCEVGIETIIGELTGLYVVFDPCGASWPSMVFKLRTSYVNPDHRVAALRRDRQDQLEMLGIYASTHKRFGKLTHPAIRRLQQALDEAGYGTKRDGTWDLKTRWALWRYRRRHHLKTPPHITEADLDALEV